MPILVKHDLPGCTQGDDHTFVFQFLDYDNPISPGVYPPIDVSGWGITAAIKPGPRASDRWDCVVSILGDDNNIASFFLVDTKTDEMPEDCWYSIRRNIAGVATTIFKGRFPVERRIT